MVSSLCRCLVLSALTSWSAHAGSAGESNDDYAAGSSLGGRAWDTATEVKLPTVPPRGYLSAARGHKTMYMVNVTIGPGDQTYRLILDTGSSLLVVPGADCSAAACVAHRRLDTRKSKRTGRWVDQGFGKGSIKGHAFEDEVCLPGAGGSGLRLTEVGFLQRPKVRLDQQKCARMSFIVADEESDEFASAPYDGIFGLGLDRPMIGRTGSNLLEQLHMAGRIGSTDFALRLSNAGQSLLMLGGVDEHILANRKVLWIPLSLAAGSNWQIRVLDFTIDGKRQNFGSFEAVVDSGTSLLAADKEMKGWLRQHLEPSGCGVVDTLPKLGMVVAGNVTLTMLPSDYVDQEEGNCSLALMPSDWKDYNRQRLVLGDSFLRRYVTVFDRTRRRLGFGVAADEPMAQEMLPAMFPKEEHHQPPVGHKQRAHSSGVRPERKAPTGRQSTPIAHTDLKTPAPPLDLGAPLEETPVLQLPVRPVVPVGGTQTRTTTYVPAWARKLQAKAPTSAQRRGSHRRAGKRQATSFVHRRSSQHRMRRAVSIIQVDKVGVRERRTLSDEESWRRSPPIVVPLHRV